MTDLKEISEASITKESITLVLSGNGKREFRILKGFSKKYDGKSNILFFPESPLPKRKTGVSALDSLVFYVNRISHFLFISDRDQDFKRGESIKEKIEKKLQERGINIRRTDQNNRAEEDALLISVIVGSHETMIYTAILGEEKCLEENVTKLIKLEYGVALPPDTGEIDRFLRQKDMDWEDLVVKASKRNLAEAFASLHIAFQNIEKFQR